MAGRPDPSFVVMLPSCASAVLQSQGERATPREATVTQMNKGNDFSDQEIRSVYLNLCIEALHNSIVSQQIRCAW